MISPATIDQVGPHATRLSLLNFALRLPWLGGDFAAKVRWQMARDKSPLISLLQDKYRVKKFVQAMGIPVPKLLHVTDDPASIPFQELPADCFIKANHGSGWNILRKDGRFYLFGSGHNLIGRDGELLPAGFIAPSVLSDAGCVELCRKWLQSKYSASERTYHRIPPRIIVEERLYPPLNHELKDYRFYTFDGRVRAINVGSPSYRLRGENAFFYPDWSEIPLTKFKEKRPDPPPPRPASLSEMISAAEKLGRGFNFVRIDLYESREGPVFGEFTFYPHGGSRNSPTACPRFNRWLGSHWRLEAR